MPITVPALAAAAPGAPLEVTTVQRRDLGPHDVLIDIAYNGICHTDLALLRNDWFEGIFPMVPGHEITGVVAAVGSGVTRHQAGSRVGVGCYVDSCRECVNCLAGEEQYCTKGEVITCAGVDYSGNVNYGGFSARIVVDENYVLRVPDSLPLDAAAPLLCAGVTMYSPLRHWKAGPGSKVAIVGMGGLGHLGVQLAHAFGAEVTVLSQSLSKKQDGLRFGATDYVATSGPATCTDLAGTFDLIISTVAVGLDLDAHLSLLRKDGVMVLAGVTGKAETVAGPSLSARKVLTSTKNGSLRDYQDMLDFCGRHGITAQVEKVAVDQVNAAVERLDRGDVRYRFVIDAGTFAG